ncbi:MAG: hypothetical protein M1834_003964 [Cirrosporium novae-zelandiae]|nr:MAG: hypothetical protein M1834_003964 [Cirrosporium novae-zelandiae]
MSHSLNQSTSQYSRTCQTCETTFRTESEFLHHLQPYIPCPKTHCHEQFCGDERNAFMQHVREQHPELIEGQVDKYWIKWQSRPWSPIKNLCAVQRSTHTPNNNIQVRANGPQEVPLSSQANLQYSNLVAVEGPGRSTTGSTQHARHNRSEYRAFPPNLDPSLLSDFNNLIPTLGYMGYPNPSQENEQPQAGNETSSYGFRDNNDSNNTGVIAVGSGNDDDVDANSNIIFEQFVIYPDP